MNEIWWQFLFRMFNRKQTLHNIYFPDRHTIWRNTGLVLWKFKLRIKFSVFITKSTMWKITREVKTWVFAEYFETSASHLLSFKTLKIDVSLNRKSNKLKVTLQPTLSEDNTGKWRQRAHQNRKKTKNKQTLWSAITQMAICGSQLFSRQDESISNFWAKWMCCCCGLLLWLSVMETTGLTQSELKA